MNNQVYATSAGQAVTVVYAGKATTKRQGQEFDALDYHFDVTIDGEARHVGVPISRDASYDIGRWLEDPAVLGTTEDKYIHAAAVDLCSARILEALNRAVNLEEDRKAYPDSFVRLFNSEVADLIKTRPVPGTVIKDYISRRLRAAWDIGTGMIDWAQHFGRVDQLYLRVRERVDLTVLRRN